MGLRVDRPCCPQVDDLVGSVKRTHYVPGLPGCKVQGSGVPLKALLGSIQKSISPFSFENLGNLCRKLTKTGQRLQDIGAKERITFRRSASRSRAARFQVPGFRVQGSGIRVRGPGSRVQGPGSKVQSSGLKDQGSGIMVQGSGSRVQGPGFRVQGSGFRVPGVPGLRFGIRTIDHLYKVANAGNFAKWHNPATYESRSNGQRFLSHTICRLNGFRNSTSTKSSTSCFDQ